MEGSCLELHMITSETFASRTNQSRASATIVCCDGPCEGKDAVEYVSRVFLYSSFPVGQDENIFAQSFPA